MVSSPPASAQVADERPNIVVVLMDNLGWGEPGVYGGGILRGAPTPRIDQLAAEGMRLLNFNVEAQCTPSRAALMTGRYAIRTGNGSVPIDTPVYGLVQWEITMAEMLSDAGYATGAFGKWHLGHTEGRFPTDQGWMSGMEFPTPLMSRFGRTIHVSARTRIPTPGSSTLWRAIRAQPPKTSASTTLRNAGS
jgi:arylsulfatase A-like enzyme